MDLKNLRYILQAFLSYKGSKFRELYTSPAAQVRVNHANLFTVFPLMFHRLVLTA
jgi:hypothetical protein